MLLLEFLDGKGVFVLQQVLAHLRFSVCAFLNFTKGMICNYYKSFVVVLSLLTSLIWMKDRDNNLKGKDKLWTQSAIVVGEVGVIRIVAGPILINFFLLLMNNSYKRSNKNK